MVNNIQAHSYLDGKISAGDELLSGSLRSNQEIQTKAVQIIAQLGPPENKRSYSVSNCKNAVPFQNTQLIRQKPLSPTQENSGQHLPKKAKLETNNFDSNTISESSINASILTSQDGRSDPSLEGASRENPLSNSSKNTEALNDNTSESEYYSYDELADDLNASNSEEEISEDELKEISILEQQEKSKVSQQPITDENVYCTPIIRGDVLTGKLAHHVIPKNSSKTLQENLGIAKKIIHFVNESVLFSDNYLQKSAIFSNNNANLCKSEKIICDTLERMRNKRHVREAFFGNSVKLYVKDIMKHKTGRCEELSLAGFYYAKSFASVEIAQIKHGDHIFLIIGRDKQSTTMDRFQEWGSDVVIVDPWTEAYYPASELKQHLMDYKGVITVDNVQHTQVKHFDASTQKIIHYFKQPTSDN